LYGFEAITVHNGWAMALAGALIVFSGLVVLSLAISQIHKILALFEKEEKEVDFQQDLKAPKEDKPLISLPKQLPADINEIARLYQPLIDELAETFYLADLYEISRKNKFPHPHITITAFRESEILIPYGEGVFTWNLTEENDDNTEG
jgi:hypothetical protein